MLGLPLGALLMFGAGIIFWGGFNTVLELTNTEAFCISCHEMEDTVYQEYKDTIHAKNNAGVKASCPDCHVPRPWIHKVARKIRASNEVYHKLLGSINTPEKFEAKRAELAQHVWDTMKATDSRECRNCHSLSAMSLETQSKQARKKHDPKRLAERGETCIDCHQGIAHKLPEDV
ncbi:NapC/NirT family cytochrome c [Shewanella sp. AS16]|nr:NapC/NirT family cytochrome c [Shewanella sp. AS16]MCE9687117.1 NapC/NirT family cytochrome c [Shewanella sp. AS16]